jgi:hypothetical protein
VDFGGGLVWGVGNCGHYIPPGIGVWEVDLIYEKKAKKQGGILRNFVYFKIVREFKTPANKLKKPAETPT